MTAHCSSSTHLVIYQDTSIFLLGHLLIAKFTWAEMHVTIDDC